ncbi:MAG: N-ATPase subunit AtpR [Planctomycetota bacterium]
MRLIDWLLYIVPFVAGSVTSLFYHGALWWTVKSLPRSRSPVLLSIGSFYLRMAITMAAFYIVMQNDWRRLAVCLAGFMAVKFIMTRIMGNASASIPGKR